MDFLINRIFILLLTSTNFYGIFEELFKCVVVENSKQGRTEKMKFHSKIPKHQAMFLHKSGLWASHDLP